MGINKDLGLPFGDGMEKVAICFDVDGTLINDTVPLHSTFALLSAFLSQKWKNADIIVWSGGGAAYARQQVQRHLPEAEEHVKAFLSKLQHEEVRAKYDKIVAFDDIQDTRLGDVNLIVRNK